MPDAHAIPLRGVRKIIADRMMESLGSSAQLTYHADADISDLMKMRAEWKDKNHNISLEDCLIFALANALQKFPDFNGIATQTDIMIREQIDLSVAISTPAGLMTPVLRGIGDMPLSVLSSRRKSMVRRAIRNELGVSDMKGGSFTLSNLGHTRVKYFTPILNSSQIALLGIGTLQSYLSMRTKGLVETRHRLPLSLTADHRIIDGEPAGKFLTFLCEQLEDFDAGPTEN